MIQWKHEKKIMLIKLKLWTFSIQLFKIQAIRE